MSPQASAGRPTNSHERPLERYFLQICLESVPTRAPRALYATLSQETQHQQITGIHRCTAAGVPARRLQAACLSDQLEAGVSEARHQRIQVAPHQTANTNRQIFTRGTLVEPDPRDAILARARSGDREAFAQLHKEFVSTAWSVAWLATADRAASEEIVADALMALVDTVETLPETFVRTIGWLRTVVRNKSVDWVRRQARRRKAQTHLLFEARGQIEHDNRPEDYLFQEETRDQVRAAMASLDELSQSALSMRYVSDMSCHEIADALEMSPSAANSLLYRARNRFRDAMRKQDTFEDIGHAESQPRDLAKQAQKTTSHEDRVDGGPVVVTDLNSNPPTVRRSAR